MNVQEFLKEKGLSIGEIMKVRATIREETEHDHPNIRQKNKKRLIGTHRVEGYYFVDCDEMKTMMFETEKEAILAQAMFLNMRDNFNMNAFRYEFIHVCRLLGLKNEWTK